MPEYPPSSPGYTPPTCSKSDDNDYDSTNKKLSAKDPVLVLLLLTQLKHKQEDNEQTNDLVLQHTVTNESPWKKRRTTGLEGLPGVQTISTTKSGGDGGGSGGGGYTNNKQEGKCRHCGQIGSECFDLFFGPYCVLAGAHYLRVDDDIPSADETARHHRDAYQHAVHFFSYLVTKCFDKIKLGDVRLPDCMIQGSFRTIRVFNYYFSFLVRHNCILFFS